MLFSLFLLAVAPRDIVSRASGVCGFSHCCCNLLGILVNFGVVKIARRAGVNDEKKVEVNGGVGCGLSASLGEGSQT